MTRKAAFGTATAVMLILLGAFVSSAFAEEEPPAPLLWSQNALKTSVRAHGAVRRKEVQVSQQNGDRELPNSKAGIGHGGGFTGKATQEPPYLEM